MVWVDWGGQAHVQSHLGMGSDITAFVTKAE